MDIGTLRGLGTALVLVAFVGMLIWVFSSKRKKSFDEAANLPFADEPDGVAPGRLEAPGDIACPASLNCRRFATVVCAAPSRRGLGR